MASLVSAVLAAVFAYGVLVGAYSIWPYDALVKAKRAAMTLLQTGSLANENLLVKPAPNASRDRMRIYDPESLQPGY